MKIEFIKAHEDNTWDTEVIDVPEYVTEIDSGHGDGTQQIDFTSPEWDAAIIAWCHDTLYSQSKYRKVVYWGIYNSEPEDD